MKVILGCDPLLQPLTGIGQYTKNLANQLIKRTDIGEFELFAHGKFFSKTLLNEPTLKTTHRTSAFTANLRKFAANSAVIIKIYQLLLPYITKFTLRKHSEYVFHSPNFILPEFQGKKIVTIHDLSTIRFPEYHPDIRVDFINRAIKNAVKDADHIITDSEYVKQEIVYLLGGDKNKITAIPLAADGSFFLRRPAECGDVLQCLGLEFEKFFLFVSTIEPRKNLLNLLKAFSLYREKNEKGFPLVIAGGAGWKNEKIVSELKRLEDKGWVRYLGYTAQENIPILYSSARALLFPSVYEGFGLPVLEAMQSGLPVLTSKDSSMSEITGEGAVLIDPHNINEMSRVIEQLSYDDNLCASLSEQGLIRSREYSWEKCTEQTITLYKAFQ